jgi:uncharacterized membrane protein YbhN (UPF0104 family)
MTLIGRVMASRMIRWGFVTAAAGLGGYAIAGHWGGIYPALDRIGLPVSLLALAALLAALTAAMQAWRVLLAGLGSPLPLPIAARVLFIGQLGKYLPGSVWPVLAQMQLGAEHRVPRLRSATASMVSMLVVLLAGLVTALVTLPFTGGSTPYRWAFLALPPALACLHPRVLNYLIARALRLARRPPLDHPLTSRVIAAALGWTFVSWILYGTQIWLLAIRVGVPAGVAVPLSVGGFALACSVGFIIVPVPAGAGVRELVLVAVLSHPAGVTVATATAVALVSRAVTVAGDLITAGLAALSYRRGKTDGAAPGGAAPVLEERPAAEARFPGR